MTLKLIGAIAQRAADRDGLTSQDRQEIAQEFGRTPDDRLKVAAVIKVFEDLVVDGNERRELVKLLGLDNQGFSQLIGIIGQDGKELLRRRLSINPHAAQEILGNTRSSAAARIQAAKALGAHGDRKALATLRRELARESSIDVRFALARAIAALDATSAKSDEVISVYVAAAMNGSDGVKGTALSLLKRLNDKRAVPVFVALLNHANSLYRRNAIDFLAKHDRGNARLKIAALRIMDPNAQVRAAADRYITKVKDPTARIFVEDAERAIARFDGQTTDRIKAMINLIDHRAFEIRKIAVAFLSTSRDARAVAAMVRAMRDTNGGIRLIAISRLAELHDPHHIPTFLAALHDSSDLIRKAAVKVLGKFDDSRIVPGLLSVLKDKEFSIVKAAIKTLRTYSDPRIGQAIVSAYIEKLKVLNEDVGVEVVLALGESKDRRAVPALIAALKNYSWYRCHVVAWALGNIKDARAVPALIAVLKNPSLFRRHEVVRALGKFGDKRAIPALIAELKYRYSGVVRREAAWALGVIGDKSAVPALVAALKDNENSRVSTLLDLEREAETAATILNALGKTKDPRAIPALIAALKSYRRKVRRRAAWALVNIGPAAVSALIAALKDRDEDVRSAAEKVLLKIKNPRAVPALIAALKDRNEDVHSAAAKALGGIKDPRVVPALIAALKLKDSDGNWHVRKMAAEALGMTKDPRAVPALIVALKDKDGDDDVRANAAGALGDIKDARAIPELIAALKDGDGNVRASAAWALVTFKDPRVVPALIAALKDNDKDVREAAAEALGKIDTPEARAAVKRYVKN